MVESSDVQSIQKIAQAALRLSGYRELSQLDCEVVDDVVILSGVVSSYYLKQVAQAAILALETARAVENRLEVQYLHSAALRSLFHTNYGGNRDARYTSSQRETHLPW